MADALIDAALAVRLNAFAPFSKFLVGAAIEEATGVYTRGATWRMPPTG